MTCNRTKLLTGLLSPPRGIHGYSKLSGKPVQMNGREGTCQSAMD